MIRRFCMLLALSFAIFALVAAPQASAQGETLCVFVADEDPVVETPPPVSTVLPVSDTTTDDAVALPAGSANATAATACAEAQAYPGPFTNMPTTPSSPYAAPVGISAPSVSAAPEAAAAPSGGLAHSGSETFVLAYLGTGLLAFGAVALGIRRGSVSE